MISRCGRRAWGSGSRCRARAASPITRRAAPTSAAAPSRATSPSSSTPSTRREWRCPAPSPPCWRRASRPTGRAPFRRRWCPTSEPTVWFLPVTDRGLRRRAGPRAVVLLALLLGGITVGYTWVVARHLRDDARDTSRLLGRVFAGLNDPRPDAATDALLDLAAHVRALGIPIAITDTAGRVTAMDNAPPPITGPADTARLPARLPRLRTEIGAPPPPRGGTARHGPRPLAPRVTPLPPLQGA